MSKIDHIWHASNPPTADVYTTRRNHSKYLTLRYWDGERWWQIEWTRGRHQEPFTWPKKSRTRFPSHLAYYRTTMGLRRINDQGAIQWGEPIKVFDQAEVLAYMVKQGILSKTWISDFQDEMREGGARGGQTPWQQGYRAGYEKRSAEVREALA